MIKTEPIQFGDFELRISQSGQKWIGIVVGNSNDKYSADSRADLISLLQKAVLEASTGFVGLKGARDRFLRLFPDGFSDIGLLGKDNNGEIPFKRAMAESVQTQLPLEKWEEVDDAPEVALRLIQAKSFIDRYTKSDLASVLRSNKAHDYLEICSKFAVGDYEKSSAEFSKHFKEDNLAKWPALTFFPFFWKPEEHMFLKPEFTREYASRIGHEFNMIYESAPNGDTYKSLLDMAAETKKSISDLLPKDNIDIHSFMWTVTEYTDEDAANKR